MPFSLFKRKKRAPEDSRNDSISSYFPDDVPPLEISEDNTLKLHGLLIRGVPPDHEEYVVWHGFLDKRGKYNTAYKRRFFILTSKQNLHYYDIAQGSHITLYNVNTIPGSNTALGHPERAEIIERSVHKKHLKGTLDVFEARHIKYDIANPFEFSLVYRKREYFLRSTTEECISNWIQKIREVVAGRYCVTVRDFADQRTKQVPGQIGRLYDVLQNTFVREKESFDSPQVRILTAGQQVRVVQTHGKRARIIEPVKGWVSLSSYSGIVILKLRNGQTPLAPECVQTVDMTREDSGAGEDGNNGGTLV